MSTIKIFTDLHVWQEARENSRIIWSLINKGSLGNDYALRNQLSSSSGSVMDNIAEGFGRGGNRELVQFLGFARGSNTEVHSQIIRALDRDHLDLVEYERIEERLRKTNIKLSNFMNYVQSSKYKGSKFT